MPSIIAGGIVAAGGATSIASGIIGSNAAREAGSVAAKAAERAADLNMSTYGTTRSDLMPYMDMGERGIPALEAYPTIANKLMLDEYAGVKGAIPQDMTQEQLEKTPGYQFLMAQNLKAIQNSATSRGLGFGGSGLKAAMNYATGLASSTYKDQFNIQQQQFKDYLDSYNALTTTTKQGYDMYSDNVKIGADAANRSGQYGTQAAYYAGDAIVGGGKARAAGIKGSADAINNTLKDLGQLPATYFGAKDYFTPSTGATAGPAIAQKVSDAYSSKQYD